MSRKLLIVLVYCLLWSGCRGATSSREPPAAARATEAAAPAEQAPLPGGSAVPGAENLPAPAALVLSFTFPLDDVSFDQAQEILKGHVARWSEVGGPDQPVRLLAWVDGTVAPASSLDPQHRVGGREGAALLAAVGSQPGSAALVPWTGPRLHEKALSIGGHRPGDPTYPLRIAAGSASREALGAEGGATAFTLSAVGDLMLGRRVSWSAALQTPDYPLAAAAPALRLGDIGVGNLETALTERGQPVRKDYTFRAAPALASGLRADGLDVVTLANNHVGDYGAAGIADTTAALDAAGVGHAGAGATAAAAAAPVIVTVRGIRVAFLSFVNVPDDSVTGFSTASEAPGDATAGVQWGTPDSVREAVLEARARAEVVVVALHAGLEYRSQPDSVQRSLAYAAVDAGAALVLGSHPHVLQGIEYYNRGVIFYSLGNFVFDLDGDDVRNLGRAPAETVVAEITFRGGQVQGLELVPMVIDTSQFRPVPAAGAAARAVLDRIYRLTDMLGQP